MNANEKLLKQAEGFGALRRLLMLINALSYMVWIGAQAIVFFPEMHVSMQQTALIQMVAGPIWLISLIAIFATIFYLVRRSDLRRLVDDERTQNLNLRAFQAGYLVLLLAIAGAYALCFIGKTPNPGALLPILLSLGVAVPSLTYAALYRS